MPVALQQNESVCLIRMDGRIGLSCAEELKTLLLEWLSTGKNLELDLDHAENVDIPVLQLLCAAARDAARQGLTATIHASAAVAKTIRDSGFSEMSGFLSEGIA
jgi:anti-anti-sigma regulatory factor